LRAELGKENIRVTTVLPGLMRTGSYKQAEMKGNFQAEYSWFALSSTSPFTTISAAGAARRIVRAVRRGEADVVLTPQAKLAALAHGVFPGLTADALGIANRLLPKPEGSATERRFGKDIDAPLADSFLTTLGERAAKKYQHEEQGPEKATVHPTILRGPAEAAS
jgi:NAD(P)-dependent dehydrogenase (short-subunit alcohol dehydrogenase family)